MLCHRRTVWHARQRVHISQTLIDSAAADAVGVCQQLKTHPEGLTDEEAAKRLGEHGPNILAKDRRAGVFTLIGHAVLNPLVMLLAIASGKIDPHGIAAAATDIARLLFVVFLVLFVISLFLGWRSTSPRL